MLDFIAKNSLTYVVGFSLVGEFRRMYADHNQLVWILGFKLLEIRNDVHTIDTTVGPEVEEDDLPFQTGQRNRVVRIEPTNTALQLGGMNGLPLHRSSFLG